MKTLRSGFAAAVTRALSRRTCQVTRASLFALFMHYLENS
jgi:hypothetical protein